nr:MAG TPA: hypothetical protein [Caudoviricetes sp.]
MGVKYQMLAGSKDNIHNRREIRSLGFRALTVSQFEVQCHLA